MNLRISGLKATDREIAIPKLTAIVAPNGTGKSAITDAIRFAVLGYVPALGKTEAATAALMSNGRMSVDVELPGGKMFSRTLERDGKSLVGRAHASWATGKSTEQSAAILELFGADAQDIAECLDIRELIALSPGQRAARIEALIGSVSTGEAARRVARLTIARILDIDEKMIGKVSEAMAGMEPTRVSVIQELAPALEANLAGVGGLPSVVNWINGVKREAEQQVKHRRAGLIELNGRLAGLAADDATREELEGMRAGLNQQIGRTEEASRAGSNREREAKEAQHALDRATESHDAQSRVLDEINAHTVPMILALEAKITEYDEAIGAARSRVIEYAPQQRIEALKAEIAGIVLDTVEDVARYEKIVEELEAELSGAKANPWAEVREIGARLSNEDAISGVQLAGLRLTEIANANMPSTDEIEHNLYVAGQSLADAGERSAAATARNVEKAERKSKLEAELAEYLEGEKKSRDRHEKALTKQRDEIADIEKRKRIAGEQAAQAREKVQLQTRWVDQLAAKVGAERARVEALSADPRRDTPETDTGALRSQIAAIDSRLKEVSTRHALASEIKKIATDIEQAEARADVAKAIEWALQRVREEELARRSGGLMGIINQFLTGARRAETPYLETGRGVCDIGWTREDGRKVPLQAMSGGEYSLFASAITAAVIIQRAANVRVLLVEAGEADALVMQQIQEGISAVANKLSYAIVLTPHFPAGEVPLWTTIELRQPEAVKAA